VASRCLYLFLVFDLILVSCNKPEPKSINNLANNLAIYEIMPRQYSEKRNIDGIREDLPRLQSMFFNAICLQPVLEHDEANNAFNPNSPFALKSFIRLDPILGSVESLHGLIDESHKKNIKVLIEWDLSQTGPHHDWRSEHPEYYLSDQKMTDNRYNQEYISLNLTNSKVQNELLISLKAFITSHPFDGIVFYHLEKCPTGFLSKMIPELKSIRPLIVVNSGKVFIKECDFNSNEGLFKFFLDAYSGQASVNKFRNLLDSMNRFPMLNYVVDYSKNDRYGSDVNLFYNSYKDYHSLTYFLPGISWVLNGQEDPQFETLNLFSRLPFSRKYKYNNDFYRSLNMLKQNNQALWNFNKENLPELISDSDNVLALERTTGDYTCVGLFNLSDQMVTFKINKDYHMFYDAFNKVPLNFIKNTDLKLGPFQSLVFTNIP
jgi:hypothetical protein